MYDRIAEAYARQASGRGPVAERELFSSIVKPGGMILDVGCGPGRDSAFFVSRGFAVTGIDLSEQLLSYAREAAPGATFLNRDIRQMGTFTASFDGVWACASLLHLTYREMPRALASIRTVMKDDATLFLYMKAGAGEHETVEPSVAGFTRFYAFYTVDQLRQTVTGAGFTVTELHTNADTKNAGKWWIACFARKGERP